MAGARAVGQRPPVFARHLLRQRQAQAAAFGTAADQRQEQVLGERFGHAAAVVDDLHPQRHGVQMVVDARAVFDTGAQDDVGGARLQGVAHQVPDRLGQAVGVAGQFRQAGVVVALQAHRPAAFVFGQAQHALQHGVDVQRRVRTLRRGRQQLFQQTVEAVDLGFDQFDQFALVVVVVAMGGPARQQLRRALQAGQRIAQLVRQPLQRGAQGIGQDLGGIQRGELVHRMRFQQPAAAVQPRQPAFGEAGRLAGHAQGHAVQAQDVAVGVVQEARHGVAFDLQGRQRLPDQAAGADAQPAGEGRIEAEDQAIGIRPRHRRAERVGGGFEMHAGRGRGRHCTSLVQSRPRGSLRPRRPIRRGR